MHTHQVCPSMLVMTLKLLTSGQDARDEAWACTEVSVQVSLQLMIRHSMIGLPEAFNIFVRCMH